MESEKVGDKVMVVFHRELRRVAVEHCHYTQVLACCVGSDDAIPDQTPGVDPAGDLYLSEYSQVHAGLRHPVQVGLQAAIVSILDTV